MIRHLSVGGGRVALQLGAQVVERLVEQAAHVVPALARELDHLRREKTRTTKIAQLRELKAQGRKDRAMHSAR
mgnify:CR=1 FL=1